MSRGLFAGSPARLSLLLMLTLAACATPPRRAPSPRPPPLTIPGRPTPAPSTPAPRSAPKSPGVEPRYEPKSAYGNPKTYDAMGKSYSTLESARGFHETGLASYYGRKFQGRKTSSGELYDMFQLTAAHRTVPLPTYLRVTNLANAQSIVVRVNDRGPFHEDRIIDLSYAAAAKLGMLGGPAMVEVEAITPGETLPPLPPLLENAPPVPSQPNYLQVAAYSDPINAVALKSEIVRLGISNVEIRVGSFNGEPIHRVLIGPYSDLHLLVDTRNRLLEAGLTADAVSR